MRENSRSFPLLFIVAFYTETPRIFSDNPREYYEQSLALVKFMLGAKSVFASAERLVFAGECCRMLMRWQHRWLASIDLGRLHDPCGPSGYLHALAFVHGVDTVSFEPLPEGAFDMQFGAIEQAAYDLIQQEMKRLG